METKTVEIRLVNLTKRFGDNTVLDNINLTIERGKFLTLLGPSGCGKSTTMRCIAGLETPTSGEIYFDDRLINDVSPHKRDIGFVFQNWALFPHLTVAKNIAFGLELRHVSGADIGQQIKEALKMVRMPGLGDRYPRQLSGGQQQRVALARAMAIRPQVLFFDEPLSNLDAKLRKEMRVELKTIHDQLGITSIYVTHDQVEAMTLSDRVALLYNGKIQQLGIPTELYNQPASAFVADFMGFENFIKATVDAVEHDKGTMAVESEIGKLVLKGVKRSQDFSARDDIEVVVRAESIEMLDGREAPPENVLEGTVHEYLYYGNQTTYFITMREGVKWVQVTQVGAPTKDKGDPMRLFFPPGSLIPIKEKVK